MLDSYTVRVLESVCGEAIPQNVLDSANAQHNANGIVLRRPIATQWGELCGSTVMAIADQMFRFQACRHTLATLLVGNGLNYGKGLTQALIFSSVRNKRRRGKESIEGKNSRQRKSRVLSPVRLIAESDLINSTGADILFGAVPSTRLLYPERIGKVFRIGGKDDSHSLNREWREFFSVDIVSRETVRMAAMMDERELVTLAKICQNNTGTDNPAHWQPCMFTIKEHPAIARMADGEILTIRRVFRSLNGKIQNTVLAAYASAVHRFLTMEFGHNTEVQETELPETADRSETGMDAFIADDLARGFAKTLNNRYRMLFWLIQNEGGTKNLRDFYWLHATRLQVNERTFYRMCDNLATMADTYVERH